jgi:hypothetical protein
MESRKVCSVYFRKGRAYTVANHIIDGGLYMLDSEVTVSSIEISELSEAVREALGRSRDDVAPPLGVTQADLPLIKAAGVSSRYVFARGTKMALIVAKEGGISISLMEPKGSSFFGIKDGDIVVDDVNDAAGVLYRIFSS